MNYIFRSLASAIVKSTSLMKSVRPAFSPASVLYYFIISAVYFLSITSCGGIFLKI